MKNLLRAAAIVVATTALVAGGATVATAAPVATTAAPSVSAAGTVAAAAAPYALDYKTKIRVQKRGSKLAFRLTARYLDDAGTPVGIRKATIQVFKKGKGWRTLKIVNLSTRGTGSYKKSDGKKRKYRMLVKPTSLYQGGTTPSFRI